VSVLVGPPRNLAADPEIFFEEEKITAERRIPAAADALRSMAGAGIRRRCPGDSSVAERNIKLLRAGNVRECKEHAKGHNKQQYSFKVSPLNIRLAETTAPGGPCC